MAAFLLAQREGFDTLNVSYKTSSIASDGAMIRLSSTLCQNKKSLSRLFVFGAEGGIRTLVCFRTN